MNGSLAVLIRTIRKIRGPTKMGETAIAVSPMCVLRVANERLLGYGGGQIDVEAIIVVIGQCCHTDGQTGNT